MIEARFFIEVQGNHREIVENSLKRLLEKLKGEDGVTVKKESLGDVIEEEGTFSSVLEVDLEFSGFLSFVRASMFYTPSAVELMEPAELLLPKQEFLESIAEVISTAKNVFSGLNIGFGMDKGKKADAGLGKEAIEELLDEGAIWAKIVFEKEAKTRKAAMSEILRTLGGQVYINAIKSRKVKSAKPFDGVIGLDALVSDPVAFVDLAMFHTPVLVEIREPEEIELTMLDLQDICLNLSNTFFEISYKVTGVSQ